MRILFVFCHGGDYAAVSFENEFKGRTVASVIDELFTDGQTLINYDLPECGEVELQYFKIDGERLPQFSRAVNRLGDDEHEKAYLETETL